MALIDLEFLTDNDEFRRLCKEYWELDQEQKFIRTVADIAQEFRVSSTGFNKLVAQYCRAYSTVIVCKSCGARYIFSSRSDFLEHQRFSAVAWLCNDCVFQQKEQLQKQQANLEDQQRAIIRAEFDLSNRRSVDIAKISFDSAVYLLALIRIAASEDFSFIWPIASLKELLTPTDSYQYDILRKLFDESLLYVHPDSAPSAFIFKANATERFYLGKVMWALPISRISKNPRALVEELEAIFRTSDWPTEWSTQKLALWKKVALEECLQYLNVTLKEHGFTLNPGEKTILVFENLLEEYSVSQAYNLIWRAVKDAAAFYLRERVSKQHAANTVVGSVQRQYERARSERWEIKPYRRDRRCPQSMVSQVLFNTALQIGEDGFNRPPGFNIDITE